MICITGGTGFVGKHLVARLVGEGEPVRIVARRPAEIPGAAVVLCDITSGSSLAEAFKGCSAVMHLVGIVREARGRTFHQVHVHGTRSVLEGCREAGVQRMIHMSALGARDYAASRYHRSKWQAEQLVRSAGLAATVFRPSVIFGEGGAFLPMLRELVTRPPIIPIIGDGASLLQPIRIEDVVSCFVGALRDDATIGHSYELCGPATFGFEQLVDLVAEAQGIDKPKVHLPTWLMRPVTQMLSRLSSRFPLTPDQLIMLLEDNCCDITAMTEAFGLYPASVLSYIRSAAG